MMNSGDRAGSIAMGFGSAALVATIFLVSSCMLQETRIRAPERIMTVKSEHIQKMACIQNRGSWQRVDYTDTCKFNK